MCPSCDSGLNIRVFPALLAARRQLNPDDLRAETGEASCFYHASKRAESSCRSCGRFVCALCAVEFDGATWCPGCLADAQSGNKVSRLENRRVLWDSVALGTATLPLMLFLWPGLPAGFASIFISIRYWRRPSSIVPRVKWRFVLAILISLTEIAFFVVLVYFIIIAAKRLPQ